MNTFSWIWLVTVIALVGVYGYCFYREMRAGIDITICITSATVFFLICPIINTIVLLLGLIYIIETDKDFPPLKK